MGSKGGIEVSYVWTLVGFVYVAFLVDVFSRRIRGWRVSSSKQTPLVTDALHQAFTTRRISESGWEATGLIHHSDAGSQYTSVAFTAELIEHAIAGSIGTVGDALDNALCESTIGLFKTEAINDGGHACADRRAVEWQVARWVHWYNNQRLHSSIGDMPPLEFEHAHRQAHRVTPPRRSRNQHTLRDIQCGSLIDVLGARRDALRRDLSTTRAARLQRTP